jgi:hypothetical protein
MRMIPPSMAIHKGDKPPGGTMRVLRLLMTSRWMRWLPLTLVLLLVAAMAACWISVTDPFCWKGRIVDDGSCAWE